MERYRKSEVLKLDTRTFKTIFLYTPDELNFIEETCPGKCLYLFTSFGLCFHKKLLIEKEINSNLQNQGPQKMLESNSGTAQNDFRNRKIYLTYLTG
ncbi:hypothetical protein PVPAM_000033000 [Plasmodium vivax]|nr:hypothetical protein PVPAM_000033000 [Plasmodium vivax]